MFAFFILFHFISHVLTVLNQLSKKWQSFINVESSNQFFKLIISWYTFSYFYENHQYITKFLIARQ